MLQQWCASPKQSEVIALFYMVELKQFLPRLNSESYLKSLFQKRFLSLSNIILWSQATRPRYTLSSVFRINGLRHLADRKLHDSVCT